MADPRNLPHLLRLLDDDTPVVRDRVVAELLAFGNDLGGELARLDPPVRASVRARLKRLLEPHHRAQLLAGWPDWLKRSQDLDRLEAALSELAEYQSAHLHRASLGTLLDSLTDEYRAAHPEADPRTLASFLFQAKALQGSRGDYYDARNSNLIQVIEQKRGLPISLSAVYMLVGKRLNLVIEGCNFPGHFLTRIRTGGELLLVDCFNSGTILRPDFFVGGDSRNAEEVSRVLEERIPAETIVRRVLNNLARAYGRANRLEQRDLMRQLAGILERGTHPGHDDLMSEAGLFEGTAPDFRVGQIVKHRRYEYRGVIVDFDLSCRAAEAWYRANRTQPDRNQPWYSVLVDGTNQVTYAAQTSLEIDPSTERVRHPMLALFFSAFEDGEYTRNSRPWPRS